MRTNSIPVYFYPCDMCETCINQIEDLITSGEISEAQYLLNEVQELGYTCPDCIALEEANN